MQAQSYEQASTEAWVAVVLDSRLWSMDGEAPDNSKDP